MTQSSTKLTRHDLPLYGMLAVVLISLSLVTAARFFDIGGEKVQRASLVESHQWRFEDRADGAILIFDAQSNRQVQILAPNTNAFFRTVMRALARDRMTKEIGQVQPFTLKRYADGLVTIEDPMTGRVINLEAFGPDNMQNIDLIIKSSKTLSMNKTDG